jgi:four helix bundle protein
MKESIKKNDTESRYDLENRLIDFASRILDVAESLPHHIIGKHLCQQIARSGTSPALNYGEAQSAESRADFIHKMKIALKELRETMIRLQIISRRHYFNDNRLNSILIENNALISIFVKSIATAQNNNVNSRK